MGSIHPDIDTDYFSRNPNSRAIASHFLASGFDITSAKRKNSVNTQLEVFILNPNQILRDSFGYTKEIAAFIHRFRTVDRRTFSAIANIIADIPYRGRVEPNVCILASEADDLLAATSEYHAESQEGLGIVPIHTRLDQMKSDASNIIENSLNSSGFNLDRFKYTLPLKSDSYYFGRDSELRSVSAQIKKGQNAGIFGLRKCGKTSLLLKTKRAYESNGEYRIHYIEAKDPSIKYAKWNDVIAEIGRGLSPEANLNDRKFSKSMASRTLTTILEALDRDKKKVILFVDEVEHITPGLTQDENWKSGSFDFWQTLRGYQNTHGNLSIIVAGVNPAISEIDRVSDIQNPMFGIMPPIFLSGMEPDTVSGMIKSISKTCGAVFDDESIGMIGTEFGGHPLLIRLACSLQVELLREEAAKYPLRITPSRFRAAQLRINEELSFWVHHVINELEVFYPSEYRMLEHLASGDYDSFRADVRKCHGNHHLFRYGIIGDRENPYIISRPIELYVSDECAIREGRSFSIRIPAKEQRQAFLGMRLAHILEEIRHLEHMAQASKKTAFYGVNSIPEADKLLAIREPTDQASFAAALSQLSRSLIEPIDRNAADKKMANYFWSTFASEFPDLQFALRRCRVYRNYGQHLKLDDRTAREFSTFWSRDFSRDDLPDSDKWWIVTQKCLDELYRSIQREVVRVSP